MAQPATTIDAPSGQTVRHGSQLVTFSTAGQLVAENIRYNFGTRKIGQMDEAGKASKNAFVPTDGTGSMTVQLKSATTKIIRGETATFLDTDGSTSLVAFVTEVGASYQQGDATKIEVNLNEKLN